MIRDTYVEYYHDLLALVRLDDILVMEHEIAQTNTPYVPLRYMEDVMLDEVRAMDTAEVIDNLQGGFNFADPYAKRDINGSLVSVSEDDIVDTFESSEDILAEYLSLCDDNLADTLIIEEYIVDIDDKTGD